MLGILWMDDSDADLARKVKEAANCYRARFGEVATLCYANPTDVPEPTIINKIRVEPRRNILPHHLLIGRAPEEEGLSEAA